MTVEGAGFRRPLVDLFPKGVVCSFNPNLKLAGVRFTLIYRTRGVSTRNSTTPTRQLPSAFRLERTETSGDKTFARQCALVCDSMNDKQWTNDLSNPSSHLYSATFLKIAVVGEHEPESEGG